MKTLASLLVSLSTCVSVSAGTFATISIDGNFTDWVGVNVVNSDAGDNPGSVDIGDVQFANDDDFFYVRVSFPNTLSTPVNISLDTDSNPATGFDVFSLGLAGTEASWQNDFPFTQSAGTFNDGLGMSGDFFGTGAALISPAAGANVAHKEWAISLSTTFNGSGAAVFADGDFDVLIWTDAGVGDVSAVIPYSLATIPEPSGAFLILLSGAALAVRRRR